MQDKDWVAATQQSSSGTFEPMNKLTHSKLIAQKAYAHKGKP